MNYREKLEPLLLSGRPSKYTNYEQYTFVVDGSITDLMKEADKEIENLKKQQEKNNGYFNVLCEALGIKHSCSLTEMLVAITNIKEVPL